MKVVVKTEVKISFFEFKATKINIIMVFSTQSYIYLHKSTVISLFIPFYKT